MTDQTRKEIERLADEFVFECPKYSGYPEHLKTFLAGAEALDKLYSEGVELDGAAVADAFLKFYGSQDFLRNNWWGHGAIWMFEQMKGRVGMAESEAKEWMGKFSRADGRCDVLKMKVKDLEAQLTVIRIAQSRSATPSPE